MTRKAKFSAKQTISVQTTLIQTLNSIKLARYCNRNAFRRSFTNRSFKNSRLRLSILEKNFYFTNVHHDFKSTTCARKNFQFTFHGAEFKKEESSVPAPDVFFRLVRARPLYATSGHYLRQQFSVFCPLIFRFPLYSKLTFTVFLSAPL